MNMPHTKENEDPEVVYMRAPTTIRERCHGLYELALSGKSNHFKTNQSKIQEVAKFVIEITKENYPDGNIPYHSRWSHFSAGGIDRVAWLHKQLDSKTGVLEKARMFYDLVVPSILLDAGAGMKWQYKDRQRNLTFSKSEGLAVASFDMFAEGLLSSDPRSPFQTDSQALENLRPDVLSNAFQVETSNPLVGLDGRLMLLRNLGKALKNKEFFSGPAEGRIGALVDYLIDHYGAEKISATDILQTVLKSLGSIWPGRISMNGVNLGDVWNHQQVLGAGATKGLVPFHKLSQWMTYSLLEPLEWCGIKIVDVEKLTGLAEYRNGGLFLDMNVIEPLNPDALKKEWLPGDEFIVEWRALTVALLDKIGEQVCAQLGKTSAELPLAKVLQGGTWAAGRKVAAKLRADGGSPVKIKSDGTVF